MANEVEQRLYFDSFQGNIRLNYVCVVDGKVTERYSGVNLMDLASKLGSRRKGTFLSGAIMRPLEEEKGHTYEGLSDQQTSMIEQYANKIDRATSWATPHHRHLV